MDGASAEPDDESVAGGRVGRPGPALERETMERRKFVIGMGALASGTAAAMGTGAFSQMTTDPRDASISVVNDDNALIALKPGANSDKVADINNDGDLVITAEDINTNSEYLFGDVSVDDGSSTADIYDLDDLQGSRAVWLTTKYESAADDEFDGDPATITERDGEGDAPPMFDPNILVSNEEYLFGIYNNSSTKRDIWLGIDSKLGNSLGLGDEGTGGRDEEDDTPSWAVVGKGVPSGGMVAVALYVNADESTDHVEGAIRVSADRDADLEDLPDDD